MQHRQQKILSSILAGTISHLVERPSLFCSGYDLLRGQDEPIEAGVSQLNAENTNCQLFVGFENTSSELVSLELLILAQDKNTEGEENMQCNVVHPQTLVIRKVQL